MSSTQQGDTLSVDTGNTLDDAQAALLARYNQDPQYGPVEEPQETEEEVEELPLAAEADVEEETEEVEEVTAKAESEEDAIEEEAEPFKTVSELADATGMELDEFLNTINLTSKVSGETSEISLATLLKGYQNEADNTRKSQALAEKQKAFDKQMEDTRTQINAELTKAGQAFGMAQQQITHEFNSVNWDELQASDPTQYMLKRQQFGERQAQINLMIEQASKQAQALKDKQDQEVTDQGQKYLQEQDSLLLSAIPDWKDPEKRETGVSETVKYLSKLGFSPDEIGGIQDHRYILLAQDAMKAKSVASDVDVALKKVSKVHKLAKPGAKPQVNQQQQSVSRLQKKLKKGGDLETVSALLLARGK